MASVADIGVFPEFRKTLLLRWRPSGDDAATLATVDNYGKVWFGSAWSSVNKLGHATAADAYEAAMANMVGGSVKHYATATPPEVLGPDGKAVDLPSLLAVQEQWRVIMSGFMAAVAEGAERG